MWSKISHDTAQKNIARVALMGSIPEGLIHAISGLQSCFSNDWLVAFYKIKSLSSTSYCLIQRMGKRHTAENNSKQTLCYVRHTVHCKHFGPKVHRLFLMIILVHKGWSHRTLLSLETKNSLDTLAERLLPWQPWPWGGTHQTHYGETTKVPTPARAAAASEPCKGLFSQEYTDGSH